nr:transmembrane protein [Tanacetum cinerariifolium]
MNNHHHHHRTTTQILKQTTTTITSHLIIFTLLSLLTFSLRSNVESTTHTLTSFIDHDPSIKSLLTRLHLTSPPPPRALTRRRRPFLQLTRVGTLDDDFFSSDDDVDDHRLFGNGDRFSVNYTDLIVDKFDFRLGFSDFVVDNGIRVSQINKVAFKLVSSVKSVNSVTSVEENDGNDHVKSVGEKDNVKLAKSVDSLKSVEDNEDNESDGVVDELQMFLKRFEIEKHEMSALLFLLGVLSASYGFAIFGFVVTYAWVMGIVFVVVVNDLLKGYKSFFRTLWDGSTLGLKRLSGFIVMRWAVRDALTQLLGVWFFGEIEDQHMFFKIFVRLKLMPFSIVSPWVKGFEREIYGFLLSWFLLDTLVSFVFAVDAWIAMVDTRKSVREVVKEGCHLLSLLLHPAINLKCLEGIVCGSFARWVLSQFLGKFFASAFQSFMEVYFMVAWLLYYFSVKSMDANSSGVPFGHRELERLLEDVR